MSTNFERVILMVADSVGIGELPDAGRFNDQGAATLQNTARAVKGLSLPTLEKLGLGKIAPIEGVSATIKAEGGYGKMAEKSPGKDTTTGHWEMMGCVLDREFPLFPNGFPPEIIHPFEKAIGKKVLCNRPASGTTILEELGEEHLKTGNPIVYTSGDSVFQIACHEEVIPLEKLYEWCKIARNLLVPPKFEVGRVIARPFVGKKGGFKRTPNRHDYSILPVKRLVSEDLLDRKIPVIGVGKIHDIYCGVGVSEYCPSKSNRDGMELSLQKFQSLRHGVVFTNLVDFDSAYGHRRDPKGYADCLRELDQFLPCLFKVMGANDLFLLTADHGCDPTHIRTTDHTREYVPLLAFSPRSRRDIPLGTRSCFADIGATLAENFATPKPREGESFLSHLI